MYNSNIKFTMEEIKTKVCPKCGQELPISEFSKKASSKDGLQGYCRKCNSKATSEYARKRRERKKLEAKENERIEFEKKYKVYTNRDLAKFTPRELMLELKARGYTGDLLKANDIYNEEYSKGEYCHEQSFKWGFQEGYNYSHENDKLEISLKEGYQFKDENGNIINATKIVLEKKEYPKTYEECCKVLSLGEDGKLYTKGYKASLIQDFQKLLICRDAYWKLYGEEI